MTDDSTKRARVAYEAFRGGLIPGLDPEVPRWEDAPGWIRDVALVAYLQGKLDGPAASSNSRVMTGFKSRERAAYAEAAENTQTFIYFVRAGEFVKIGKSRHWKRRVENMQVGSPHTIVPLLVLVGNQKMEFNLHNRFRSDHYRGEWFHMGPAINAFIKSKLKDCVAKTELSELPRPPRKDGLTGWDDAFPDEEVVL